MAKRILVVDDEPAISRLVQMTLSVEGYEVRTAASGFAALEEMETWPPDLVILDIMMPGMNGYEVCQEIKKNRRHKTKVMFLTAMGISGDAQRGLAVGGDDYILKPFDPEELHAKVRSIIGLSK